MRRIGDVVERLDARDAVVAVVGARQELRRDDVGHAVAVVDVEPDDAHARRDEVVVRAAAAEHVEYDAARLGEPRQRGPQVVEQPAQMQIVELPRPRMPARATRGAGEVPCGIHRSTAVTDQRSRGLTAGRKPSSDSPGAGATRKRSGSSTT